MKGVKRERAGKGERGGGWRGEVTFSLWSKGGGHEEGGEVLATDAPAEPDSPRGQPVCFDGHGRASGAKSALSIHSQLHQTVNEVLEHFASER